MHNFNLSSFRAAFMRFRPPAPASSSRPNSAPRPRPCTTAAGAGAVGPLLANMGWGGGPLAAVRLGSVLAVAGGGAGFALSQTSEEESLGSTADLPWVAELASRQSVTEVLSPGQQLRQHPIGKLIVDQDHLVSEPLTCLPCNLN